MIQRLGALAIFVGLIVLLAIPVMADTHTPNQVGYWCEVGEKFDGVDAPGFQIPQPPDGYTIGLVVVKAGQTNDEYYGVLPGDTVVSVSGQDVSHVIVCYVPEGTTTTTEQTTTTVVTTTTTIPETTTTQDTVVIVSCDPDEQDCDGTTTTTEQVTTTTAPPVTTTTPPTASTLPVTGADDYTGTAAAAGGLMLAGAAALAAGRFAQADE